jgi:hypothetical protein
MADKKAADLLAEVGRALHGDEWPTKLAADLGVTKDTLRTWRRGRDVHFGPGHHALDRLLALVEGRAGEVARARDELREWLRRNRG